MTKKKRDGISAQQSKKTTVRKRPIAKQKNDLPVSLMVTRSKSDDAGFELPLLGRKSNENHLQSKKGNASISRKDSAKIVNSSTLKKSQSCAQKMDFHQNVDRKVSKTKLKRGYKLCQNCNTMLNIHKYVCNQCGHVHNMKKHKLDIMKNLSKGTPKVIRSILEAHEFNEVEIPSFKQISENTCLNRLISQKLPTNNFRKKSKAKNHINEDVFQKFKATNVTEFQYIQKDHAINCVCKILFQKAESIELGLLLVENLDKKLSNTSINTGNHGLAKTASPPLVQNEGTVKALHLENYHQVGARYSGVSSLSYVRMVFNQSGSSVTALPLLNQIKLNCHIQKITSCGNTLALLTGDKNVLLFSIFLTEGHIYVKQQSQKVLKKSQSASVAHIEVSDEGITHQGQNVSSALMIKPEHIFDQFTSLMWLSTAFSREQQNMKAHGKQKSDFWKDQCHLVCGTMFGHLLIYKISLNDTECEVYRFICNAHFESVNCLAECPLSQRHNEVFASGSYDGTVKVWNLPEKECLLQIDASNRKVHELHWDSGAKFLLIVRDENLESLQIASFYSIDRVEVPINLTESLDFRLIRGNISSEQFSVNHDEQFHSTCPMVAFPTNSKILVSLNNRNGVIKILQSQEIRRISIKRKKSKKAEALYPDYQLRIIADGDEERSLVFVQKVQSIETKKALHKIHEIYDENSEVQDCKKFSKIKDNSNKFLSRRKVSQNSKRKGKMSFEKGVGSVKKESSQPVRRSLRARNTPVSFAMFQQQSVEDSEQVRKSGKKRNKSQSEEFDRMAEQEDGDIEFRGSQDSDSDSDAKSSEQFYSSEDSGENQSQRFSQASPRRHKNNSTSKQEYTQSLDRRIIVPALPLFSSCVLFTAAELASLKTKANHPENQTSSLSEGILFISSYQGHLIKRRIKVG